MKVRWVIHLKRRVPRAGHGPWRVVSRQDEGAPWTVDTALPHIEGVSPLLFATEAEAEAQVPSVQGYYGNNFIAYAGARRVP